MAIFTRREIQRRIDRAAAMLTGQQLESIVDRLNLPNRAALEAEWELIWLTSLSTVGVTMYEPKPAHGKRYPDVYFKSHAIEFLADITAVSDSGYNEENPIDELHDHLERLYRKHRVFAGFSVHIESKLVGEEYRDQRVRLLLPKRGDIPSFLRRNFDPFVRAIAKKPDQPASHTAMVPEGGTIRLDYDPKRQRYNYGASHLSYNVPYSLTRNPITNALKRKKRQLANSGWDGLRGVILCDSDCNVLTTTMNSVSALRLEEIVHDFLRQNHSIGFVLTIGVQTTHNHLSIPRESLDIRPKLFHQSVLNLEQVSKLKDVFNCAIAEFPPLVRNASRAVWLLDSTRPLYANCETFCSRWPFTLGNRMQTTEIKISARALAAVLGGELDFAQFRRGQQITSNVNGRVFDFFQTMVREGRTIVEAKIEPCPNEDDDLIVLRFGLPDAAASRFRAPSKSQ